MRALRILLVLALLCAAALAGVAWLANQPATLAWLLERGASAAGGKLVTEELSGSLFAPIGARRLVYEDANVRVEIENLDLRIAHGRSWRERALHVERVAASAVLVVPKGPASTEPVRPPASLALPIGVTVDAIEIGRLLIRAGATPIRLEALAAAYRHSMRASRHALELANLDTEYGRVAGTFEIAGDAPFELFAVARVAQPSAEMPYRIEARAGGELERIGIGVDATVDIGTAHGALVVQPFRTPLIDRIVVRTSDFDPRRLDRRFPSAQLAIEIEGALVGDDRFDGRFDVKNAARGPIDRDRVPLASLSGAIVADIDGGRISGLVARGGGSVLTGAARFTRRSLALDLKTDRLDLAEVHSRLRRTALAGRAAIEIDRNRVEAKGTLAERNVALDFDLTQAGERLDLRTFALRAGGGTIEGSGNVALTGSYPFEIAARSNAFDPSALGGYVGALPAASITAELVARGTIDSPRRIDGRFRLERGTYRGYPIDGEGVLAIDGDRADKVNVSLGIGDNRLAASGAFGAPGDALQWRLAAPALAALGFGVSGRLTGDGTLSGVWTRPEITFSLAGESLAYAGDLALRRASAAGRFVDGTLDVQASASGVRAGGIEDAQLEATLRGTQAAHRLALNARAADVVASALASGALASDGRWRGSIEALESQGRYPARLTNAPVALEIGANTLRLGAAEVALADGSARVARLERSGDVFTSEGTATGLAIGRLAQLAGQPLGFESDLRLGASWRIVLGTRVDADLRVARESGDAILPVEAVGAASRANRALGLTRLEARLRAAGDRLDVRGEIAGTRIGAIRANLAAPLVREGEGWRVPRSGALAGEAVFEGGELASLTPFIPAEMRVAGSASGQLRIAGTVGVPQLVGNLSITRATFAIPDQGVRLRDGRAELRFTENNVRLVEARFAGERGTLAATGDLGWQGAEPAGAVRLVLTQLDAITDPLVRVVVSGTVDARIRGRAVTIEGRLAADEGAIRLPDDDAPTVSADVVVRGREPKRKEASSPAETGVLPNVDLILALGDKFTVRGRGVDTRLTGELRLRVSDRGTIRLTGTVATESGTVTAYGQTLRIERGTVTFTGPIDNPTLNITAIRPNIPSRVGVTVTGLAQAPRANLFSDQAMTNSERLGWLVLGRAPETLTPTDLALVGAAAAGAVIGGNSTPITSRIADAFGLDEVAVRSLQGTQSSVVALGKRLSDKLYVSFEQSLGGLGYALRLRYELGRNWSIQTQAGLDNTVDLLFTKRFD